MITGPINNAARVTMSGNIRPEVATATDRGPPPDSKPCSPWGFWALVSR
jgi:hypothetical protein